MKKFNVIAAVALNGVIGSTKTNDMPWRIREDLQYFKAVTSGKTIVAGFNTYLSMPSPLPLRRNVVVTSKPEHLDRKYDATYTSFSDLYEKEVDEFFVVGGARLYKKALEWSPDEIHITVVHLDADGDVVFPLPGSAFLQKDIMVPVTPGISIAYQQTSITDMREQNGIQYQFALFKPRHV